MEQTRERRVSHWAEALAEHMSARGIPQATMAKILGISTSTLSQFLAGVYKGRVEKIEKAVQAYLQRERERKKVEIPKQFVETQQALQVLSALKFAHVNKTIGVVYGSAGLGKTESIRKYASQNRQVMIITADPTMNTKGILEEILEQIGIVPRGDKRKLLKKAVEALEGTDYLIIVDEAQHLRVKEFEVIRKIHDAAGVGVVFVGTAEVYDRMTGKKNVIYDQLFSRVGIRRYLRPEIKKKDVSAIMQATLGYNDKEILEYLWRRANQRGGLRTMMMTLRLGNVIAQQKGKTLDVEALQEAERFLWEV